MNRFVPAPGGADVRYLGAPGQVNFPLPWDLLASAPWLIIVYLAFTQHWPPVAIIALVVALTPLAVLSRRSPHAGLGTDLA